MEQKDKIEAEKALMEARWAEFQRTGKTIDHETMQAWALALKSSSDQVMSDKI